MIQSEIKFDTPVRACDCGRQPRLIRSAGNRLITHHFECARCTVGTSPVVSLKFANVFWRDKQLHPLAELRYLRPSAPPLVTARPRLAAPSSVSTLRRTA